MSVHSGWQTSISSRLEKFSFSFSSAAHIKKEAACLLPPIPLKGNIQYRLYSVCVFFLKRNFYTYRKYMYKYTILTVYL